MSSESSRVSALLYSILFFQNVFKPGILKRRLRISLLLTFISSSPASSSSLHHHYCYSMIFLIIIIETRYFFQDSKCKSDNIFNAHIDSLEFFFHVAYHVFQCTV